MTELVKAWPLNFFLF